MVGQRSKATGGVSRPVQRGVGRSDLADPNANPMVFNYVSWKLSYWHVVVFSFADSLVVAEKCEPSTSYCDCQNPTVPLNPSRAAPSAVCFGELDRLPDLRPVASAREG